MPEPSDILTLVQRPGKLTRREVGSLYGRVIAEHFYDLGAFDWTPTNNAILARWSIAGLEHIKRRAWKLAYLLPHGRASADDAVAGTD